jgi:uncharacterized membrane protein
MSTDSPCRRKTAIVFLLLAGVFGISFVFLTPPLQVADEHTHFYRAYDVSQGHLIARAPVVLPKSLLTLQTQYPPRLEIAWAEYRRLTSQDLLHSLHEDLRPDDTVNVPSGHIYTFVPYIPSACGVLIARQLGASALGLLYAGRFCNWLVYTCLIYWALMQLPAFHLPFLMVAAMPMSLQQAASLSGDSVTIAVTLLYLAQVLSLCLEDETQRLSSKQCGVVLLVAMVVVMAKANVAVVLLPLMIPAARFGGSKRKVFLIAAYLAAAYLPFALWQYLNRENIEAFRAASLQAGVDIPANIAFLKAHPAGFLRVVWRTMHLHWVDYLTSLVGTVGWNAARLPSWIVGSYLLILALVSMLDGRGLRMTARQRLLLAAIFVTSLLSVFVALWSLETQQRFTQRAWADSGVTIANVQGRYFITVLALAVLVIPMRTAWPLRTAWPMARRVGDILAPGIAIVAGIAFWVAMGQAYYASPSNGDLQPSVTLAGLSNAGIVWGGFYLLQAEDNYREGCQSFHFLDPRLDTVPLLGDWNADGRTKAGIYRKGVFYLDYNGRDQFEKVYSFVPFQPGDVPVIGDWNGDGRTKIGIFRSGFLWILDYNGNGKLDAVSKDGDRVFGLGGIPMDLPVVGDWNGDGRSKAGIYRHGVWLLQAEDTLTSNVTYITQRFGYELMEEGRDCDIPVVGDWTGDHKTKIGMLLVHNLGAGARTYQWILDRNGNGIFDAPGMLNQDELFDLGGTPGDVPFIWNLGRGRASTAGIYRHGTWIVRQSTPGKSAASLRMWHFGGEAREIAVPANWSGDGNSRTGVLRGGVSWVLDDGAGTRESIFSLDKFGAP